ncbi:MAG: hypothetical protein II195_03970 [Selenomonadales bacterium]|nr:hypothetical protein [Selenomonadales bacterium]
MSEFNKGYAKLFGKTDEEGDEEGERQRESEQDEDGNNSDTEGSEFGRKWGWISFVDAVSETTCRFIPSPGLLEFYHEPAGPRVRVDSGVCAGLTIEPYYDSLIAKVVAYGRTRGDAIKIMRRALNEFRVGGIKTTIPLHKQILADSHFCTGNLDTQFLNKRMPLYEANKNRVQKKRSKGSSSTEASVMISQW